MPCKPLYCMCGNYAAPQRHVMATLCVFFIMIMYAHRVSLSLAIVEMVLPIAKKHSNSEACPLTGNESTVIKNIHGGARDWSESDQAIALQSFYIGYLVFQFPLGYLCDRYGAKFWMLLGNGLSTVSTALIPPAVIYFNHWIPLVILRIFSGAGQAVLYPGVSTLMGRWIPVNERGMVGGLTLSASALGAVFGNIGTGIMIKYTKSWVYCFYIWAVCGVIWGIFFGFYVYSYPEIHKHITDKEREYLQEAIGKKEKMKTPFKEIFSDVRVWVLMIAHFGYDYFHYTILTDLPKYMNNVLNYKVAENAVVSSVPQLCMFLSAISVGRLGDYLICKKGFKIVKIRIICTVISLLFPATFMLVGGYMNCNRTLAIVCFCIALVGKGIFYIGLKLNIIDASINHSGFLMALVNGTGSLAGIISPYVIAMIVKNNSLEEWHLVFWIMAGVGCASTIIYIIFAKGERAQWDYPPEERVETEKKCIRVFSCFEPH